MASSASEVEVQLVFDNPEENKDNPELHYEMFGKILAVRNHFADFYSKLISDAYPEKLRIDIDNKIRFNFKLRVSSELASDPSDLTIELGRYKDEAVLNFELDFEIHVIV